jgi:hypothetical protein
MSGRPFEVCAAALLLVAEHVGVDLGLGEHLRGRLEQRLALLEQREHAIRHVLTIGKRRRPTNGQLLSSKRFRLRSGC